MVKTDNIQTPRLTLLKVTPTVFSHVFDTFDDEGIIAFFGVDSPMWLAREKERHQKGTESFNRSFLNFIIKLKATGKVIGACGFHTWYTDHDRAEIGYGIYNDADKQQGYMAEALHAVLRYGFTEMNLHRVEALTATYNIASINTLKKFGFTHEGTLREHYNVKGIYEPSEMYSLLKYEFIK